MARKRIVEEHENHERWLVSYADFITLLFAFFVVMYAISHVNDGKYRVLSDSLVVAFSKQDHPLNSVVRFENPQIGAAPPNAVVLPIRNQRLLKEYEKEVRERAEKTRQMQDLAQDLRSNLANLIDSGQVRVTESKRGIAIEVNASLLFPIGSATLDEGSLDSLSTIARKLADAENLIQIEGHTDNAPINSPQFPSNWELSAARAGTVVRLFESAGVAPRRLVAIGYSNNRPLVPEAADTPATERARNRRVSIQILADNKDEVATVTETTAVPASTRP